MLDGRVHGRTGRRRTLFRPRGSPLGWPSPGEIPRACVLTLRFRGLRDGTKSGASGGAAARLRDVHQPLPRGWIVCLPESLDEEHVADAKGSLQLVLGFPPAIELILQRTTVIDVVLRALSSEAQTTSVVHLRPGRHRQPHDVLDDLVDHCVVILRRRLEADACLACSFKTRPSIRAASNAQGTDPRGVSIRNPK